jgi:hypothetical protein
MRVILAAVLLALAAAGCVTSRDFVRPNPVNVRLGTTTGAEIRAAYGRPSTERSWSRNEADLKDEFMSPFGGGREGGIMTNLYYYHSDRFSQTAVAGVEPSKSATFWFLNDKLVGYITTSSFAADPTVFDEAKVGSIKPWKSLRADVIAALGQPSGVRAFPLVQSEDLQVLSYFSFQIDRGARQTHRRLFHVLVDSIGVVRDVRFDSSTKPIVVTPTTTTPVPIYIPPTNRRK